MTSEDAGANSSILDRYCEEAAELAASQLLAGTAYELEGGPLCEPRDYKLLGVHA